MYTERQTQAENNDNCRHGPPGYTELIVPCDSSRDLDNVHDI